MGHEERSHTSLDQTLLGVMAVGVFALVGLVLKHQSPPYVRRRRVGRRAAVENRSIQPMGLPELEMARVGVKGLRLHSIAEHELQPGQTPMEVAPSSAPKLPLVSPHSPYRIMKLIPGLCKCLIIYVCFFGSPEVFFIEVPWLFLLALIATLRYSVGL
jgi:hypothetical protein